MVATYAAMAHTHTVIHTQTYVHTHAYFKYGVFSSMHGSDHGTDTFDHLEEIAEYNKACDDGGSTAVQQFIGND